jgi:hypothetical protein
MQKSFEDFLTFTSPSLPDSESRIEARLILFLSNLVRGNGSRITTHLHLDPL